MYSKCINKKERYLNVNSENDSQKRSDKLNYDAELGRFIANTNA